MYQVKTNLKLTNQEVYRILYAINSNVATILEDYILHLTSSSGTIHRAIRVITNDTEDLSVVGERMQALNSFYVLNRLSVILRNIRRGKCKYIEYVLGEYILTDKSIEILGGYDKLIYRYIGNENGIDLADRLVSRTLERTIVEAMDSLSPNLYRKYNPIMQVAIRTVKKPNEDRNFTFKKDGKMTYLPANRRCIIKKDDNNGDRVWAKDNRQEIKIGKALNKMFSSVEKVDNSLIEYLGNHLKASYTFVGQFEIVEGEDIRKYYHYENYSRNNTGSLSASCMRHDECQDYMTPYVNSCKMLIAKNNEGHIIGRALLWDNVVMTGSTSVQEIKFMDRIYGNDITIEAFKQWAADNGYYRKKYQSYSDLTAIVSPDNTTSERRLSTKINGPIEYWPYLDTFRYADYDDIDAETIHINNDCGDIEFNQTNGSYEGDERVTLHDGDRVHEDDARYVDRFGEYWHYRDVTYSDFLGEYVPNDDVLEVDGEIFWYDNYRSSLIFSEYHQEDIIRDRATYVKRLDAYVREELVIMTYDGSFDVPENLFYCEINNKHYPLDMKVIINGQSVGPNVTLEQVNQFLNR